jgi:molybdopterin-binding protein
MAPELHIVSDAATNGSAPSARNRIRAVVTEVRTDGRTAHVELVVSDPVRLVAEISRDAMDELALKPGMAATAIVNSTSIIVQH